MSRQLGIMLICNRDGRVVDVLCNPPELGIAIEPGMLFARIASNGSMARALSFLSTIRTEGAAFNQEINVVANGQVQPLYFAGGVAGNDLLIIGALDSGIVDHLYTGMMSINNEQTNALRSALKQTVRDDSLYDEISRLNNELVTAQRELAKTNAQLQQINSEKNRFLSMATHDLRNPLHTILIYSEFLAERATGLEDRKFLQVISDASHFMAQLVDDLLDVAKIEAGEMTLDYAVVDLAELMQRNADLNSPLAVRRGVDLYYKVSPLPPVLVDGDKLIQILNNLIGNAIKFSQPGKYVTITVENAGEDFLIRVADNGPGIAPEQMARLFQPFQRGQRGNQGERSTGLGLAIVKRIVEGHGGKIWLESTPGQGTTFFVSIPHQPPDLGKGAR